MKRRIEKARSLGLKKSSRLLLNKVRRKLHFLATVPPTVYVELTDICNLKCIMCDRNGMTRKSGMMSEELFKRVIDNAVQIGVPSVKLNRFGETLLHPHLIDMIRYAKEKGVPWTYFTSNATLLDEEMSRNLISSGLDSITFSFDGAAKETYERIRVNANYEKTRDNILTFARLKKEMASQKPRVVINTILSRDTKDEIYDVFKLWNRHVDKVNVLPIGRYGNVKDLSWIERKEDHVQRRPCHQLFDRLMIFWDGTATVCCADINGSLSIGHVDHSRIEDLWRGKGFSKIRHHHKKLQFADYSICKNCDGTNAIQYEEIYRQRRLIYRKAEQMGYRDLILN